MGVSYIVSRNIYYSIKGDKKVMGHAFYAITLFKLEIMRTNKVYMIEN